MQCCHLALARNICINFMNRLDLSYLSIFTPWMPNLWQSFNDDEKLRPFPWNIRNSNSSCPFAFFSWAWAPHHLFQQTQKPTIWIFTLNIRKKARKSEFPHLQTSIEGIKKEKNQRNATAQKAIHMNGCGYIKENVQFWLIYGTGM